VISEFATRRNEILVQIRGLAMKTEISETSASFEDQVRQWRHPVKNGLITIAGDEDGDIPELTASFLFGGAQIELPDVLDCN
jgi:hypothetical protein